MEIHCCACGEEIPEYVEEAIDNELVMRVENGPIMGVVCKPCVTKMKYE